MIEQKQFAGGGLNQDVDENFLKPNEWTNALNIRNTDRLEGSDGVISNIKGNTLVPFTLPEGTNKCIGNYANELTAKYYSFIYNSNGYHTITEYNNTTGVLTKVLQSKTDTGGIDILKFQPYELINGVSMIGGVYLYWTDGYNQPRGIDIAKAKTGIYYTDEASICLAKQPPLELITCAYANDPVNNTSSNRLKRQLFQFRYLYVYEDNTRSAWSSCSEVPLPVLEVQSAFNSAAYRNNNIVLNFNVGDKFVKRVEVAAQVKGVANADGTQDWFSILSVDRSELISSPQYAYDALTNLVTYKFYNDGLYQSIDVQETDLSYDFVPLKSKTLDIVNGNVLVLGNNTEGYDNVNIDIDFDVTYQTTATPRLSVYTDTPTQVFPANAVFSGVPFDGDEILIQYPDPDPPYSDLSYNFIVSELTSANLYDTLVDYANAVTGLFFPATTGYTIEPYFDFAVSGENYQITWSSPPPINTVTIIQNPAANTANSNASYKTNSRYQFGLVYYDEFNRSTYVQTSPDCIVATSSWGATSGESPQIAWTINHTAPTGFDNYQWVRTEQLTHKQFVYAVATAATPSGGQYYNLNITSFDTYNDTNQDSILSYDFTPGDRCTVHKDGNTWKTGYDVEVIGFNPGTNLLTILYNGPLTATSAKILIEIYTPKLRSNTAQEQFFYEFGEVFSCSGGVHSVTSGTFTDGDIYTRDRVYDLSSPYGNVDFFLEDPNFSDFYISNYSSNGRTNIFAPQAKQLNLPTDIRFSDTYVPNTNINGLTRFYGNAFETYDRVNGSIQKLAVRDNYLMTFQELKTGYIPILQSIIEDQGAGNAANVAISNKLLNKIRYFAGDYGIGTHPESFARFAGTMYFADPNRGEILKLTQGLQPISKVGMDSYFTAKLSYTNNITNAKVLGSYDPRNDEYIVTFKYPSPTNQFPGNNQTVAFSEDINRWTSFYSFIPDCGGYIFNQYITYQNGTMWTQNTNDYYGNFYGVAWSSSVDIVYNASPSLIKTFIGVMEQASTVWTPVNIDTSTVQVSELPESSFSLKEGVYFASLLREKTGDIRSLYFGNDLKGNWIKLYLAMGSNAKQTLLSVDVRHIPSYQGIK